MAEYEGFRACYGSRQKPGKVTVSWSIAQSGKVSGATIGSSSLHDQRVENCVLRQFGRLRFPPAAQATHSSFTFTFTPTPE
jgi:TonB family protein